MRHSGFKTIDHRKILLPLIHLSYLNIFDNIDLSIQVINTLTFVISQKSMNGLTFLNLDGGWLDGNGRDRITGYLEKVKHFCVELNMLSGWNDADCLKWT